MNVLQPFSQLTNITILKLLVFFKLFAIWIQEIVRAKDFNY